jgi:hypothetical protein
MKSQTVEKRGEIMIPVTIINIFENINERENKASQKRNERAREGCDDMYIHQI